MGQKVSTHKTLHSQGRQMKGKLAELSFDELDDIQERAVEQYPWLADGYNSCTVTDNSLPDNPIVWVNDAFEQMTRFPREEIVGVNCRFLQGPLTNRETIRQVKLALVEGRQTDVDILNYRKDGIPFYNQFSILPIYSRDGQKVTHFLSIQKDVTHFQEMGHDPRDWTPPEVATFLLRTGYEEYARQFIEQGITGEELLDITRWELETQFSMTARKAVYLLKCIEELHKGESPRRFGGLTSNDKIVVDKPKKMKNSIAVKCYIDDDKVEVYLVSLKTSLSAFEKQLRRELHHAYRVHALDSVLPMSAEEWSEALLDSQEQTLLVTLVSVGPMQKCVKKSRRAPKRVDSLNEIMLPQAVPASPQSSSNSVPSSPASGASHIINNRRRPSDASFFSEDNYAIKAIRADPKILLNDESSLNLFTTDMFEECEALIPALNKLFEAHGQHYKLLMWSIQREMSHGDPNTFFREDTASCKVFFGSLMTPKVQAWLGDIVAPTIRKIAAHSESYEIEACRFNTKQGVSESGSGSAASKEVKTNVKAIQKLIRQLIDRLPESIASCPSILRQGMALMRYCLAERYGTEIDDLQIATSLFFLRFLCTALLNVSAYPELNKKIGHKQHRSLVLVSKIVQFVANSYKIPSHKTYAAMLNPFIEEYNQHIIDYVQQLTSPKSPTSSPSSSASASSIYDDSGNVVMMGSSGGGSIAGSSIYGGSGEIPAVKRLSIGGRVKLFDRPNKAKEEALSAVRDCCIYLTA